jgi:hypothetical protein
MTRETTTMTRTITDLKIYWDISDRSNEGWAYRACDDAGLIDSGSCDGDTITEAIEDACRQLDMDLTPDHFAVGREDGGVAIWTADA